MPDVLSKEACDVIRDVVDIYVKECHIKSDYSFLKPGHEISSKVICEFNYSTSVTIAKGFISRCRLMSDFFEWVRDTYKVSQSQAIRSFYAGVMPCKLSH